MRWQPFDSGHTVGTRGSEDGIIILDEEHQDGARITLERNCRFAPVSITCGIYGCFFHTTFASTEIEARIKFDEMKIRLQELLAYDGPQRAFHDELTRFANEF